MTILTLNRKELEKKIGKITPQIEEKITMMGAPVEESNEKEISVEVFPNRPDLLSLQGFSRALLQYLGKAKPSRFKVYPSEKDYAVKIEKSVKPVRPFTQCAIVKGLKFDDEKIKEIIDIQEKLHMTIGRKRKKVAIGIYPLDKIKLPIRFAGRKPDEIKFIPLEMDRELTGAQILRQHPTGREYANLLKDAEVYPVFIDADDKILSMPPIINSQETGKITEKTKDVFIECSGFNKAYLKKCINIIATALFDMDGKIYSMTIEDSGKESSPDLEPWELDFKIEDINKMLGLELSAKEISKYLYRMGVDVKNGKAVIPSYRADILHWVDLAEEVAIAYGYNNFKEEIPRIPGNAEDDKTERNKKVLGDILAGLGLLECSSFHLAVKNDVKKMHYDFKDWIGVEDSKTEYNILRIDLMSNLLKILSENSDASYPQKIFEIGRVFSSGDSETGIKEDEHLAVALIDEKITFTDAKQILNYLFKMLDKEYKIEEVENNNYIPGRVGKILSDRKEIGRIGEVAPRVLKNFGLGFPVAGFEIDLNFLID